MQKTHCDLCDATPAESTQRLWLGEKDKPFNDPPKDRLVSRVIVDVAIVEDTDRPKGPAHLCRSCWRTLLAAMIEKLA
jgi:hypothetical protein